MKRLKLLVILLVSLIMLNCETVDSVDIVRLPPVPGKPVLENDLYNDNITLTITYYRMLLWSYNVKYMVGEILESEYEEKKETILNIISEIEKATYRQQ